MYLLDGKFWLGVMKLNYLVCLQAWNYVWMPSVVICIYMICSNFCIVLPVQKWPTKKMVCYVCSSSCWQTKTNLQVYHESSTQHIILAIPKLSGTPESVKLNIFLLIYPHFFNFAFEYLICDLFLVKNNSSSNSPSNFFKEKIVWFC